MKHALRNIALTLLVGAFFFTIYASPARACEELSSPTQGDFCTGVTPPDVLAFTGGDIDLLTWLGIGVLVIVAGVCVYALKTFMDERNNL